MIPHKSDSTKVVFSTQFNCIWEINGKPLQMVGFSLTVSSNHHLEIPEKSRKLYSTAWNYSETVCICQVYLCESIPNLFYPIIRRNLEILACDGMCSRDSVQSQGTYSTAKSKAKERNSVPCCGRCVREITWMFAVKQNNLPNRKLLININIQVPTPTMNLYPDSLPWKPKRSNISFIFVHNNESTQSKQVAWPNYDWNVECFLFLQYFLKVPWSSSTVLFNISH